MSATPDIIVQVRAAGGRIMIIEDRLKVRAPLPLPDKLVAELRLHKAEVMAFLTRPVARVVLLHCPPGVPETWTQGVADLLAMTCPASCPDAKWQALREDAYTFLRDHAARAHGLGWTEYDLFGAHPAKPWVRFDCMGLVPLLNGTKVTALSDIEAVIEKPNGARVTFHRHTMAPDETCLVWELGCD